MITSARIEALRKLNETPTPPPISVITALRAPAIAKLARDTPVADEPVRHPDLAEISHPTTPGTFIACRNPALAAERARKRSSCWPPPTSCSPASPTSAAHPHRRGRDRQGGGQVIDKHKMGKHFHTTITDTTLTYRRTRPASTPKPP